MMAGQTTATPMASIPAGPPPVGRVIGPYVEIDTVATYVGPVAVGLPYDESSVGNKTLLKLFHYDGSSWQDVTLGVDIVNNVVYGEVTSLSPFVIVEEAGPEPTPINWPLIGAIIGAIVVVGLGATILAPRLRRVSGNKA